MSVCNTCALEKECMLKYDVSARMFCNRYIEKKPLTNADRIRAMTDDELAEWYWWMLRYVQGYTDSRVALREWLKQDYTTFIAQEYKKDLIDRLNREGIAP